MIICQSELMEEVTHTILRFLIAQSQESCGQVESAIRTRGAELMDALERRQGALIEFARRERDVQLRRLRDEVSTCTAHLQSTTALVQFCIAALKEADSSQAAFLQIGAMLVERVSNLHSTWSLHQSRSMQQQETEVEEEEEEEEEEATSCSRRLSNGGATAPATSRSSCSLQLTLDDLGLRRSIDQLTFLEMKRKLLTLKSLLNLNSEGGDY